MIKKTYAQRETAFLKEEFRRQGVVPRFKAFVRECAQGKVSHSLQTAARKWMERKGLT